MLSQEGMIEKVRQVCNEDDRLMAAMMYGSFAQGEGDGFSDIEFLLFFDDGVLGGVDQEEWVSRVAPVELFYVNEFGVGTAIFENLVRGEFHFNKASDIGNIDESLKETDWLRSLEDTLVLDRTGELTRRLRQAVGPPLYRDTPEEVRFLSAGFVNWFLFGSNLLLRGELARALDLLGLVQDHLLYMARLHERSTRHWFNPSKLLEEDLSGASYARYAACTSNLDEGALREAYLSSWRWGKELIGALSERHSLHPPVDVLDRIGRRLAEAEGDEHARR
jgi:lincosamide nucleotidyltransferase